MFILIKLFKAQFYYLLSINDEDNFWEYKILNKSLLDSNVFLVKNFQSLRFENKNK